MAGNAKNIRLGPCHVIWGVEDLGYTKGGIEVSITSTQVSITSDQFGETPMDKYVTSRTVNVKVPIVETTPGKLDLIINGNDGTASQAVVQAVVGLSMRNASQSLILHPLNKADDDYSEDFVVIRAGVIPNIEATYDADNERVWSVTFTSFPYYGEKGVIPYVDKSGVLVYGDRSGIITKDGITRLTQRDTNGTYIGSDGFLKTAPPYALRPNYVYKNGVWVQQGYLREAQLTVTTQTINWWIPHAGVNPDISNANVTTERMVLPTGEVGNVNRFVPVDVTKDMYIPYSFPLFREAANPTGHPVWSCFVYIPNYQDVDPSMLFCMGVYGQSEANWSPHTRNWSSDLLARMEKDPANDWHLYIPPVPCAGGWVRVPIGGRTIGAGNVCYAATFRVPGNTFTTKTVFPIYMWGANAAQYEAGDNYCSSFIMGTEKQAVVTRAAD